MPATPATPVSRWIARSLKQEPPRAKSLVMTVFGDAIAPYGGSVWLGSLITLLAPLAISERLVRTSVFRLVDEGWLEASRSGRRSLYRLSKQAEHRFLRAHQRVYAAAVPPWDGSWTLVMPGGAAMPRGMRLALKKSLAWEGFGEIAPGVLARPGRDDEALADALARAGSDGNVLVLQAREPGLPQAAALASTLEDGWPLAGVRRAYRQFLRRHQPLLDALSAPVALSADQAFIIRTLLIHAYRRVQLHDPRLPPALLGDDWPGQAAHQLCREIYLRVAKPAEGHIASALAAEEGETPQLAPRFAERFA